MYVKQSASIKNGNKVIGCPRRAGKCADATGPKKRHNHRDSISQMVVDWHIGPDTARSLPRVQMILGGVVGWGGVRGGASERMSRTMSNFDNLLALM